MICNGDTFKEERIARPVEAKEERLDLAFLFFRNKHLTDKSRGSLGSIYNVAWTLYIVAARLGRPLSSLHNHIASLQAL